MVRAGRNAQFLDEFLELGVVGIGWRDIGDLSGFRTQKAVLQAVRTTWPDWKPGKQAMSASQLYRFASEMSVKDKILTYDPHRRIYHLGSIAGDYRHAPGTIEGNPHLRSVTWEAEIERDRLSVSAKNSLGAISTLFRVPEVVMMEIEAILSGKTAYVTPSVEEGAGDDADLLEDVEARALEFIKDRVSRLDWEEMQELVAGLLRAMGYKTKVSPLGPDRGKDIVASPDGFGFESPRIVVEVKHRGGAMGAAAIRSFLGGRHPDDKGLYVSTGGFSKDAYYEAERASIPLTLMTLDDLVEALIANYECIDVEAQRLVPLKRVYWPV
jgi:restriction system protein